MGKNKKKTGKKAKRQPPVENIDETANEHEAVLNSVNGHDSIEIFTEADVVGGVDNVGAKKEELSEGADRQEVGDDLTTDEVASSENKKADDEIKVLKEEIKRLNLELDAKKKRRDAQ